MNDKKGAFVKHQAIDVTKFLKAMLKTNVTMKLTRSFVRVCLPNKMFLIVTFKKVWRR